MKINYIYLAALMLLLGNIEFVVADTINIGVVKITTHPINQGGISIPVPGTGNTIEFTTASYPTTGDYNRISGKINGNQITGCHGYPPSAAYPNGYISNSPPGAPPNSTVVLLQ